MDDERGDRTQAVEMTEVDRSIYCNSNGCLPAQSELACPLAVLGKKPMDIR